MTSDVADVARHYFAEPDTVLRDQLLLLAAPRESRLSEGPLCSQWSGHIRLATRAVVIDQDISER